MQNAKSKNEERGEGHTTVGTGVLDRPKMKWGKEKERPESRRSFRMVLGSDHADAKHGLQRGEVGLNGSGDVTGDVEDGVGGVTAGLVGHVLDVQTLVGHDGGELGQHTGNVLVQHADTGITRAGHGDGGEVHAVLDVTVAEVVVHLESGHDGAVVLGLLGGGAKVGDQDGTGHADELLGGEVGDVAGDLAAGQRLDHVGGLNEGLHIELANAGGDVAQELFTRTYEIEGMELTLDYYFSAVRNLFVKYMLSAGISTDTGESYMLWDLYGQSAVRPVLAQMADLLLAEREKRVYEGNDVYNIMLAFRSLTPADKNTFFILGVNQTYYAALERYFYSKDASLTEMVPSLLRAEIAYAVYQHNQTSENRANFIDEFANAMAAYEKLANKDQLDESLRQMYELYKDAYNNMRG